MASATATAAAVVEHFLILCPFLKTGFIQCIFSLHSLSAAAVFLSYPSRDSSVSISPFLSLFLSLFFSRGPQFANSFWLEVLRLCFTSTESNELERSVGRSVGFRSGAVRLPPAFPVYWRYPLSEESQANLFSLRGIVAVAEAATAAAAAATASEVLTLHLELSFPGSVCSFLLPYFLFPDRPFS